MMGFETPAQRAERERREALAQAWYGVQMECDFIYLQTMNALIAEDRNNIPALARMVGFIE